MAPPQPRRLLFVSVPLLGHVKPLLEPARLLVQQGQQVLFLCYEQRRANIEQAGIPFRTLGHDSVDKQQQLAPQDASATKKSRMLAAAALYTDYEEDMFHPILQACRSFQPDIIVADLTTLAAHDAAEALKLPLALLGSMPLTLALDLCGYSTFNASSHVPFEDPSVLVMHEHMSLLERHVINPLCKKVFGEGSVMHLPMLRARDVLRESFGLPDMALGAGPLQVSRRIPRTITILATSWLMEAKRDLPHGWHLVGCMGCDVTHNFPPPLPAGPVCDFLDKAQAAGVPAMLVATGTSTQLPEATVKAMAAAFASLHDVRFVWSIKQESQLHLPEDYSPSNVLITTSWVPQTAVLGHPAVKAFLCHGGHTTTNEALATGTPMLCMPLGGDQLVVAQHIKDHGFGLQISLMSHSPEAITAKICKLLGNIEIAATAAAAGQKVRSCCGAAVTAWLLADFARDPPEVESSDSDSAPDSCADDVASATATAAERSKEHAATAAAAAAGSKKNGYKSSGQKGGKGAQGKEKEHQVGAADVSLWPRFDRARGTGLSRSAVVNAH